MALFFASEKIFHCQINIVQYICSVNLKNLVNGKENYSGAADETLLH